MIAVGFILGGVSGGPLGALSVVTGGAILLVCAPVIWAVWKLQQGGGLSTKSFFDEQWALWEVKTATFHGLAFRRVESDSRPAESWKASLADIARVEAVATKQWIASRQLGNVIHPVTDVEWQAFLFMNDGSRRVICSVNGNRELAATLAQSVRSWLEAMKTRAVVPARSYARAEGFDI
jgi:hypothetical protein